MSDEFVIWGLRNSSTGSWRPGGHLGTRWSFDKQTLETTYKTLNEASKYRVEQLPDEIIATIPEAADALIRYLRIKNLREVRNE